MHCNYNYPYIINLESESFKKASNYFIEKYLKNIAIFTEIEAKSLEIQELFNINHPNLSFGLKNATYSKENKTLSFAQGDSIKLSSVDCINQYKLKENPFYEEESLILIEHREDALEFIKNDYLLKSIKEHEVAWFYKRKQSIHKDDFFQTEIPSNEYVNYMFFRRQNETFFQIINTDLSEDKRSINTLKMAHSLSNLKSELIVNCIPSVVESNEYVLDELHLSLQDALGVRLDTNILSFKESYDFTQNSPFSVKFGDTFLIKRDLSNAKRIVLTAETSFAEKLNKEIITTENAILMQDTFLKKDTEYIEDAFTVDVSSGDLAISYRYLSDIIVRRIASYLSSQLRLFIDGYSIGGSLSELIKFTLDKILELESQYVKNDECSLSRTINNIDESCKLDCLTIEFKQTNKMITKQRLKSQLLCALSCEGEFQ